MLTTRFVVSIVTLTMTALGTGVVFAQGYPNKPIRVITTPAPGPNDTIARIINQGITGPLGQPLIVEHRPSGVIPGETVSKSPADGYTLLFTGSSLWLGTLFGKTPYDPVKDFAPITFVSSAPSLLVVHPSLPVKSVKDMIALAKSRPGELNYSTVGTGATSHLSAVMLQSMTGINIVRVSYSGPGLVTSSMLSGETQLTFGVIAAYLPYIKSGRLKGLAVSSAKPSALFPGVPTIAETVPGFESVSMQGMFAPAKTPDAIVSRLNQEIVRVLNQGDVKEKLLSMGVEPAPSSPDEFAAKIKSELTKIGKVVKDAGLRTD